MLIKMKKLVKDSIHILKLEYKMNKKTFIYEMMSGLSENAVSILKVILPALIIDSIMNSDKIDTALWLIAAFAVVISICALIQKRSRLMLVATGYETGNLFNLEVNKKMLRMDYPKTEDAKIHDMKDNAVESLWSFLEIDYIVLNSILGSFFTFLTMLYIIATLDFGVFVFILVLSLLNIYVEFRSNKKIYDIEKVQAPYNRKIKYTKELMQGISAGKEIRVFHAKDFFIRQYQSFFEGQYQGEKKIEKSKFKLVVFQSITGLIQMLVLYIIAIDHYKGGLVSLGSFVMYVGVIQSFTMALQDIFLSFVELSKVTLYFGNYDKFMKIDESMNSGTSPCKDKKSPCIEFRNVSFRYTNQSDYVLKNINLKISPDDKIALVGENGAGKTTLVKLLVRLYDVTEGEILLDGVNIKNYKYDDYLSLFSPVFQDYMMYFYSFKENIVFDRLDEEKLDKCLETTGLDKKFDELQDGVDTFYTKEFSETGVDLSGGEQQRVAIARAFYKDSPIAVLDEPTASLDPITENDIYKQFNENIKGKTSIFISHRMSSTSFCDKIIVLDKGSVVESGTHKELLQRNGLYAQMYDKQSVYYQ